MSDDGPGADLPSASRDGDWDSGEGGPGWTRSGSIAAAAVAVAFIAAVALLGAYIAAFNEMLGVHRLVLALPGQKQAGFPAISV